MYAGSSFQIIPGTSWKGGVTKISLPKPTKSDRRGPKVADIATIPNQKFVIAIKYSQMVEPAPTFELPNQFLV